MTESNLSWGFDYEEQNLEICPQCNGNEPHCTLCEGEAYVSPRAANNFYQEENDTRLENND